ncbi:unnamed protein product [Sphagnum jensenii]|uniref:Carbohydrate kinase PfkB domain-containing protein n=1 Tax=Sphagnum jensenii TaxID=128206 RepID=A0ABP1AAN4_9BRYO
MSMKLCPRLAHEPRSKTVATLLLSRPREHLLVTRVRVRKATTMAQQTTAQTLRGVSEEERSETTGSGKTPPAGPQERVLVGCGGAALDFLASVESFPRPDEKMRTTELQVKGGGNVGNALTAASRLGLNTRIFTKVANDGPGKQILDELQGDGIDTSNVVIAEVGISPFTYVIVDKETSTRTCIHTPGSPPLEPQELTPTTINALLTGAHLVYFDGRLTDTALILAKEATERHLPILVDAERKREGLDNLLTFADYIVASAKFPLSWTEEPTLAEALLTMMVRLPRAKFLIVTLGASGCVMLERHSSDVAESKTQNLQMLLETLLKEAEGLNPSQPSVVSSKVVKLTSNSSKRTLTGRLLVGTAEAIPSAELVDTTGAGDAFIGAVMYSLLAGLGPEKMLPLGAIVAAGSCRALGARTGVPGRLDTKVAAFL